MFIGLLKVFVRKTFIINEDKQKNITLLQYLVCQNGKLRIFYTEYVCFLLKVLQICYIFKLRLTDKIV